MQRSERRNFIVIFSVYAQFKGKLQVGRCKDVEIFYMEQLERLKGKEEKRIHLDWLNWRGNN